MQWASGTSGTVTGTTRPRDGGSIPFLGSILTEKITTIGEIGCHSFPSIDNKFLVQAL